MIIIFLIFRAGSRVREVGSKKYTYTISRLHKKKIHMYYVVPLHVLNFCRWYRTEDGLLKSGSNREIARKS